MNSSKIFSIERVNSDESQNADDYLAVEEPLEIRISFLDENKKRIEQPLSVTMRTPAGQDTELGAGFLFTEGIIHSSKDIRKIIQTGDDIVIAELTDSIQPDIHKLERHFYTTSSCGVCGKTSIEAVKTLCPVQSQIQNFSVSTDVINSLPLLLIESQKTFSSTGGLHASALFDEDGKLILVREDVGRHNALDKLIGAALQEDMFPLQYYILLLSGRASFELIQKAAMAGIYFVCSVGAPSSLAVELAAERKMTLIGFLRNKRFNIYCGSERVLFHEHSI